MWDANSLNHFNSRSYTIALVQNAFLSPPNRLIDLRDQPNRMPIDRNYLTPIGSRPSIFTSPHALPAVAEDMKPQPPRAQRYPGGIIDSLKGFPEAISAVYPESEIQTCIVHLLGNSLSFCNWKERKAVAGKYRETFSKNETPALAALFT
jgi:Transposase, Mutator family